MGFRYRECHRGLKKRFEWADKRKVHTRIAERAESGLAIDHLISSTALLEGAGVGGRGSQKR